MADKHENGDVTFDELKIGDQYMRLLTNRVSTVVGLTVNSVEMYNSRSNHKKHKDDRGKHTGINSKCWYDISLFNREYRKLDEGYIASKRVEYDAKQLKSNYTWKATFEEFI